MRDIDAKNESISTVNDDGIGGIRSGDIGIGEDAPIESFRKRLKNERDAIEKRFASGEDVAALIEERSLLVDGLLRIAWRRFDLDEGSGLALSAIGGYGRSEMHPFSDIDILLVGRREPDAPQAERIKNFLAFLWSLGLSVGSCVRTPHQCAQEAARDITVATSLMDGRLICGNERAFEEMRRATGSKRLLSDKKFHTEIGIRQDLRHHHFHDTAHNLEPNIKEGPGGLRDFQTIVWVARRYFSANGLGDLVKSGLIGQAEEASLVAARNFLWRIRFGLHLIALRAEERLLFEHQRSLAKTLGFADQDHPSGIESLMKVYYRSAGEISRLNEILLAHFREGISDSRAFRRIRRICERFRSVDGYLDVRFEDVFERSPRALMDIFLVMQRHPQIKGIRASTIRLIRARLHLIDDRFRDDPDIKKDFVEILRGPNGVYRALQQMHRYGILGAYLPAFGQISGLTQHNLLHIYTVDEHSLFVVRNIVRFADPESHRLFPHCAEIFARLPKPELLVVAGLFHDIAKGRKGDHSEAGAIIAYEFCKEHFFDRADCDLVAWLVRQHLSMSLTAQRRDISDPEVVAEFARAVKDRIRLDYLYLLTIADIRGTNPEAWNDWRRTLLHDLYLATLRALMRGLDSPVEQADLIRETRTEACRLVLDQGIDPTQAQALWENFGQDYLLRHSADEICWHTRHILPAKAEDIPLVLVRAGRGGTEIFVYARDQEFLFAATVSILERLSLTVLSSRIMTGNHGLTLDSLTVVPASAPGEKPRSAKGDGPTHEEIQRALQRGLRNPAKTPRAIQRISRRQLRYFTLPAEIDFTRDAAGRYTLMQVIATDLPGLLARIGWLLADAEVRIQQAKIASFGERAEDIFHITDKDNRPFDDVRLKSLHQSLCLALGSGDEQGTIHSSSRRSRAGKTPPRPRSVSEPRHRHNRD
ncbi:[protein-PII] uridylyltransferase [Thioalkalivibrio sp. HK1]|uniref:[protein-PII] uridylyltransferase n=1 Tax=Thioalkalivibrio sp. HK1 TaxID=1469245 RepID=UPI00046F4545|nr:[protein-PII] uridylyltransferase [Thioalkalivibrio sp. HK1]